MTTTSTTSSSTTTTTTSTSTTTTTTTTTIAFLSISHIVCYPIAGSEKCRQGARVPASLKQKERTCHTEGTHLPSQYSCQVNIPGSQYSWKSILTWLEVNIPGRRLEIVTSRLEIGASRLEIVANRLEIVASRLEIVAS